MEEFNRKKSKCNSKKSFPPSTGLPPDRKRWQISKMPVESQKTFHLPTFQTLPPGRKNWPKGGGKCHHEAAEGPNARREKDFPKFVGGDQGPSGAFNQSRRLWGRRRRGKPSPAIHPGGKLARKIEVKSSTIEQSSQVKHYRYIYSSIPWN